MSRRFRTLTFSMLVAGTVIACGRKDESRPPDYGTPEGAYSPEPDPPSAPLPGEEAPSADVPSDAQIGPIATIGGPTAGTSGMGGMGGMVGMGGRGSLGGRSAIGHTHDGHSTAMP